jgi:hypothetical protein
MITYLVGWPRPNQTDFISNTLVALNILAGNHFNVKRGAAKNVVAAKG